MRRSHYLFAIALIYTFGAAGILKYFERISKRFELRSSSNDIDFKDHIFRLVNNSVIDYNFTLTVNDTCRTDNIPNLNINNTRNNVLITIFTTWKINDNKNTIHVNSIKNWFSLGYDVRVILFLKDFVYIPECTCPNCEIWSVPVGNKLGVPVLKYMFLYVQRNINSTFYAFVNSDILFNSNLLPTLETIHQRIDYSSTPVIVIGRRTNVMNVTEREASSTLNLEKAARQRGKLFRSDAQDYFITSKNYPWENIPELIIGSPAYDNWLVTYSLVSRFVVIDATTTILAVHQTTSFGNYEGFRKNFKDYNVKLIESLYNSSNQVRAGHTVCTDLQTKFARKKIIVQERRVNVCRRMHKKYIGKKRIGTPWRS